MSESNPYAPADETPQVAPAPKAHEPKDDIPSGTVKEVNEWVGDDKARAELVLEHDDRVGVTKNAESVLEQ